METSRPPGTGDALGLYVKLNNKIMRLNYTFGNILFTILCLGIFSFSANGQSVEDLEIKHGFQDIKLDSEISDYSNLIFKKSIKIKKSEEPILLYEPEKGSYQRIGDVSIKDFEVRAFLGKIIEIKIITPKIG